MTVSFGESLRQLKATCGGTLEISQREAGGTKVAVFAPLQKT